MDDKIYFQLESGLERIKKRVNIDESLVPGFYLTTMAAVETKGAEDQGRLVSDEDWLCYIAAFTKAGEYFLDKDENQMTIDLMLKVSELRRERSRFPFSCFWFLGSKIHPTIGSFAYVYGECSELSFASGVPESQSVERGERHSTNCKTSF